jgi:hypothetical protein
VCVTHVDTPLAQHAQFAGTVATEKHSWRASVRTSEVLYTMHSSCACIALTSAVRFTCSYSPPRRARSHWDVLPLAILRLMQLVLLLLELALLLLGARARMQMLMCVAGWLSSSWSLAVRSSAVRFLLLPAAAAAAVLLPALQLCEVPAASCRMRRACRR